MRGCGFPARLIAPLAERRISAVLEMLEAFPVIAMAAAIVFLPLPARSPLAHFLPRGMKTSIPNSLVVHRSCGRNATG